MPSSPQKQPPKALKRQLWILGTVVVLLWGIQIVNFLLLDGYLVQYGIQPRQWVGLRGIFIAPLLHGSFNHLLANTVPLVTLGWLIMLQKIRDFLIVTSISLLISGLGIWVVGAKSSIHIGASGIVFGYMGYLLLRGYFERSSQAIAIALLVILVYGGLLISILPIQAGVSWEGHLFGFLGGGVAAKLLSKQPPS